MKKVMVMLFITLFLMGVVLAEQEMQDKDAPKKLDDKKAIAIKKRIMNAVKAGDYITEEGKKIKIQEREDKRFRIHAGNFSADCECNLTHENVKGKTRLHARLSNGEDREIKIMPDVASQRAIKRLRLKKCGEENNCSIELKEVGKGNATRIGYEVRAQKQARIFGLFKTKMQVKAQVSSEDGEVIRTEKPWWAFLASEEDELDSEE